MTTISDVFDPWFAHIRAELDDYECNVSSGGKWHITPPIHLDYGDVPPLQNTNAQDEEDNT